MSNAARTWLEERRPAQPSSLAAALDRFTAEAGVAGGGVADRLADAGLLALRAALERPDDRAGAFDLLAADALITYAFEAAAEEGTDAVNRLAGRLGPDRLAELLPGGTP